MFQKAPPISAAGAFFITGKLQVALNITSQLPLAFAMKSVRLSRLLIAFHFHERKSSGELGSMKV
jgi:hypothetical protein